MPEVENNKQLNLFDDQGIELSIDYSNTYRTLLTVGRATDVVKFRIDDRAAQQVTTHLNNSRPLFVQHMTEELGYIAALGQVIRAIKMHRTLFGTGLTEAKRIIEQAAAAAREKYYFPRMVPISRAEELENALRETRLLVSKAAQSGFTNESDMTNLAINQSAISRVVPPRPQDIEKLKSQVNPSTNN